MNPLLLPTPRPAARKSRPRLLALGLAITLVIVLQGVQVHDLRTALRAADAQVAQLQAQVAQLQHVVRQDSDRTQEVRADIDDAIGLTSDRKAYAKLIAARHRLLNELEYRWNGQEWDPADSMPLKKWKK